LCEQVFLLAPITGRPSSAIVFCSPQESYSPKESTSHPHFPINFGTGRGCYSKKAMSRSNLVVAQERSTRGDGRTAWRVGN